VFSQPAAFTSATHSQFADRAPRIRNWDLRSSRTSRCAKAEAAIPRGNVQSFNTVRFGGPNTSVTSNQFGQISSQANSPRQVQFGLKLIW
jgi:hypothetical protein